MPKSPGVGTPASMRELNQRVVLERLRVGGAATRPRIAADTGLSKPTVGQALLDLEQHGLVRTAGRRATGPGRAAVIYEVNPAAGHVLGVDIGRELIRTAVADLAGDVVARLDRPNKARSSSALIYTVRDCAEEAAQAAGLRLPELVTTVVGTPGVPDPMSATLHRAPNLPDWERKGLLDELRAVLGTDLIVENDANLAAIGEHEAGAARGVDVFVCLTVGTGIGMGIVVNGTLFQGAHGAAGEVGYLPYGWPPPDTPPRQGMLESAAAAHSVVTLAAANGLVVPTAKEVFQLAREGDSRALRTVEQEAERLAFAVAAVTAVIDPALVVLGGGVGKNTDLLAEPLNRALVNATPLRPKIVPSQLGEEGALTGAIAIAVRTAREVVFERRTTAGR